MKIPHSSLFQGGYLFPEGSNYLLINKYWGSKYFPVNNYWGVLFFGEYLLTVAPVFLKFSSLMRDFFRFVSNKKRNIEVKHIAFSSMMNSSICSHFSHLWNSVKEESRDELSLNLLGRMLTLYLRARTLKHGFLQKEAFKLAESEVFQEHQSSKLQRNSNFVINKQ